MSILPYSDTPAVGDNLESDVRGIQRAGFTNILALSGHTTPADLARSEVRPDYVVERPADLL